MSYWALYIAFIAGFIATAIFISWVVSDCQLSSNTHICTVALDINQHGVLHFSPVQP